MSLSERWLDWIYPIWKISFSKLIWPLNIYRIDHCRTSQITAAATSLYFFPGRYSSTPIIQNFSFYWQKGNIQFHPIPPQSCVGKPMTQYCLFDPRIKCPHISYNREVSVMLLSVPTIPQMEGSHRKMRQ